MFRQALHLLLFSRFTLHLHTPFCGEANYSKRLPISARLIFELLQSQPLASARMEAMTNKTIKRGGFSSSFGVLAATFGSAVGLGNIWKFPYLTGTNGGAGFLLIYLLATLVIGPPVMSDDRLLRAGIRGGYRRHAVADGSTRRDPA
jgi:hypothetical protein